MNDHGSWSPDWDTGLPGYTRFWELLDAASERCETNGARTLLVTLHIQDFKYGWVDPQGAELIRAFAERLRDLVGNDGKPARVAIDKFAVLFDAAGDLDNVEKIASELRDALQDRPFQPHSGRAAAWKVAPGDAVQLLVSVGHSELRRGRSAAQTLRDAEKRMHAGRNTEPLPPAPASRGRPHLPLDLYPDGVTNIAGNYRHQLNSLLEATHERCERARTRAMLLVLHINDFHAVNMTCGHAQGDAVLCEFAERLCACLNVNDTPGRFAGDQFWVILADGSGADDAAEIGEKVRLLMNDPFSLPDGTSLPMTVSIGHAPLGAGTTVQDAYTTAENNCDAEKVARRRLRSPPTDPG